MVQSTRATGRKTSNMEKESRLGQMVHLIKECTKMEKSMAKVHSSGLMVATIRVTSLRIILRVQEHILGVTEEFTPVTGKITRWKAKVLSPGQMVAAIPAIMLMTRKRARACFTGQMAVNMTVNGSTENKMALVLTPLPAEKPRGENGVTEKESIGFSDVP